MRALLLAAGGLALAAFLLNVFLRTPPADLARRLKMTSGIALLLLGALLLFMRQFALALPLIVTGLLILRRQAIVSSVGSSGQTSQVRAAGLDMVLDHDSGEMDGEVLAGRHSGRRLSELGLADLNGVAEDFRGDAESLRLLEGYLDRVHPGWRDEIEADGTAGQGAPARAGGMSPQEAYEILGLDAGAGEADVREAHRRLMKQVHPDRGGSAALAAKINEAKDRILGRHR